MTHLAVAAHLPRLMSLVLGHVAQLGPEARAHYASAQNNESMFTQYAFGQLKTTIVTSVLGAPMGRLHRAEFPPQQKLLLPPQL